MRKYALLTKLSLTTLTIVALLTGYIYLKNKIDPSKKPKTTLAVLSAQPLSKYLVVGDSFTYLINQFDYNNNKIKLPVIFSSSNPKIAYVDKNGKVKALREGETKIRISSQNKSLLSWVYVYKSEDDIIDMPDSANKNPVITNGKIILSGWPVKGPGEYSEFYVTYFNFENISKKEIVIDLKNFYMLNKNREYVASYNDKIDVNKYADYLNLFQASLRPDLNIYEKLEIEKELKKTSDLYKGLEGYNIELISNANLPRKTSLTKMIIFKSDYYFMPEQIIYDDKERLPLIFNVSGWF